MFDKDKFARYLDSHAREKSTRKCAEYVREALEAGGIVTRGHPELADQYGPFLEKWGFYSISSATPSEVGDIAIIQPTAAAAKDDLDPKAGHIAAYDGHQWVSDYFQRDAYGGQYRKDRPPITFYRYGGATAASKPKQNVKCPHCTSELHIEQRGDNPAPDDPVSCYFHGLIGTRHSVMLAVGKGTLRLIGQIHIRLA